MRIFGYWTVRSFATTCVIWLCCIGAHQVWASINVGSTPGSSGGSSPGSATGQPNAASVRSVANLNGVPVSVPDEERYPLVRAGNGFKYNYGGTQIIRSGIGDQDVNYLFEMHGITEPALASNVGEWRYSYGDVDDRVYYVAQSTTNPHVSVAGFARSKEAVDIILGRIQTGTPTAPTTRPVER